MKENNYDPKVSREIIQERLLCVLDEGEISFVFESQI